MPTVPLRRAVLSFVAVVLVYANVAVCLNPYLSGTGARLPLPAALDDLFLIFGVFSYYETTNQEMTLWGLARDPASERTYWKQLSTDDYFPHGRGEQNTRIWAARHYHSLDRDGHWQAWRFLGRKILDRHNRRNPHDPITKVAIQSITWPRSVRGYYAERTPATESKRYWIVAE